MLGTGTLVINGYLLSEFSFLAISVAWEEGGDGINFMTIPSLAWNAYGTPSIRLHCNNKHDSAYVDVLDRTSEKSKKTIKCRLEASNEKVFVTVYGIK